MRTAPTRPPRALNLDVDGTLEKICLKCLNKSPAQRYASADDLAQDLRCYRMGQETHADPWTRLQRVVSWFRPKPVEAALAMGVLAILIFAVAMGWIVVGARNIQILEAAKFTAGDLAATAEQHLNSLRRHVELVIANPSLAGFVEKKNRSALQTILDKLCSAEPKEFATWYVANQDGVMIAHSPPNAKILGKDFNRRDYFRGAKELGLNGIRRFYISRLYRGESDGLVKFAISAPILDGQNHFLGIVNTTVKGDASLGGIIPHDGRRAAIIGPADTGWEPGKPTCEPKSRLDRYCLLFHFITHQNQTTRVPAMMVASLKSGMSDGLLACWRGPRIFLLLSSPIENLPFNATMSAKLAPGGNPEATFAVSAGHPMAHSKRKAIGRVERLEFLTNASLVLTAECIHDIRVRWGRAAVAADDIIDAAACLVTASRCA